MQALTNYKTYNPITQNELFPYRDRALKMSTCLLFSDLPEEFRKLCADHGITSFVAPLRDQLGQLAHAKARDAGESYGNMFCRAWSGNQEVAVCQEGSDYPFALSLSVKGKPPHTAKAAAFPDLPDLSTTRTSFQNVASIVTGCFHATGKTVELWLTLDKVNIIFSGTSVRKPKIGLFLEMAKEIFQPTLKGMKETEISALTGERWAAFVVQVLSRTELNQFLSLGTIICSDFLGLIKNNLPKKGLESVVRFFSKKATNPVTNFDRAINAIIDAVGYCAMWVGPLPQKFWPNFVPDLTNDKMKSGAFGVTLAILQRSSMILGGKTNGYSILSAGRGFFNMTSERERKVIRIVSMLVQLIASGKKVSLSLDSIGEVALIFDAVSAYAKWANKREEYVTPETFHFVVPMKDVQKTTIPKEYIASEPTPGFVLFLYSDSEYTLNDKNTKMIADSGADFLEKALSLWRRHSELVYYGPVWGRIFDLKMGTPLSDPAKEKTRQTEWFVYPSGNADSFKAFFSNIPNLNTMYARWRAGKHVLQTTVEAQHAAAEKEKVAESDPPKEVVQESASDDDDSVGEETQQLKRVVKLQEDFEYYSFPMLKASSPDQWYRFVRANIQDRVRALVVPRSYASDICNVVQVLSNTLKVKITEEGSIESSNVYLPDDDFGEDGVDDGDSDSDVQVDEGGNVMTSADGTLATTTVRGPQAAPILPQVAADIAISEDQKERAKKRREKKAKKEKPKDKAPETESAPASYGECDSVLG